MMMLRFVYETVKLFKVIERRGCSSSSSSWLLDKATQWLFRFFLKALQIWLLLLQIIVKVDFDSLSEGRLTLAVIVVLAQVLID